MFIYGWNYAFFTRVSSHLGNLDELTDLQKYQNYKFGA